MNREEGLHPTYFQLQNQSGDARVLRPRHPRHHANRRPQTTLPLPRTPPAVTRVGNMAARRCTRRHRWRAGDSCWIAVFAVAALMLGFAAILAGAADSAAASSARSAESASAVATVTKLSAAKKQWIAENEYSVEFLTDLPARVTVAPEVPFPGERYAHRPNVDAAGLRALVGEPTTLRNVEITKHHFSCCDGRSSDEILGTWGGDAGEMILAIAVWEDLAGRNLTSADVAKYVRYLLAYTKQEYVYIHTDTVAFGWLEEELGVVPLDVTRPPSGLHDAILEAIIKPEAIGCVHLRSLVTHSERYGVRRRLVEMFLQEFHRALWDSQNRPLGRKIVYYILSAPSTHREAAWVDVEMGPTCDQEERAVMLPPYADDVSVFVNHPHATVVHRNQTSADFVVAVNAGTENLANVQVQLQKKGLEWKHATEAILMEETTLLRGMHRYKLRLSTQ